MTHTLISNNYEDFSFLDSNAPINNSHVETIKASMLIKQLLPWRPILVNKDMQIIDGQHRFLAAKSLGHPIYYQKNEELTEDDMGLLNSNTRNWKPGEWIHHWKTRGKEQYKILDDFCSKYNITCHLGAKVLKLRSETFARTLKAGTLSKIDPNTLARGTEIMDTVMELKELISYSMITQSDFIKTVAFLRGLIALVQLDDFDAKVFKKKLDMQINKIIKCTDSQSYFNRFLEIYNWKNQNPIGR